MSLQSILLHLASDFGLNVENDETRNLVIHKINAAAQELYTSEDLVGSLDEAPFSLSEQDNTLLTFPTFVGKIRAIVDNDFDVLNENVTLESMWKTYQDEDWFKDRMLQWREIDSEHPLMMPMEDVSHLRFKLRREENVDVTIRVSGKTDWAENDEETVTIPAGSREVSTSRPFIDVESMEKTEYNLYDIDVYDHDNNQLSVIHNCYRNPMFYVMTIQDERVESTYLPNVIRVLFKKRFKPFVRLSDRFQADGYDECIAYAFVQKYYGNDEAKQNMVDYAVAKEVQIRNRMRASHIVGKNSRIIYSGEINDAIRRARTSSI